MCPRGCLRRKPALPYRQRPGSAGPYRRLSSGQWAFSERLSVERADTGWEYESARVQKRRPRPLRGIHCSHEHRKCLSPWRQTRRWPNFPLVPSMVRVPQVRPSGQPEASLGRRTSAGRILHLAAHWLVRARLTQLLELLLQERPMRPRGCSHRKPELACRQGPSSAGPCRRLSSVLWAFSERLPVEPADTGWKYESAPAQKRRLRPLRGIRYSRENHKCLSPWQTRPWPNFPLELSMARVSRPFPLRPAQLRRRPGLAQYPPSTFPGEILRMRCELSRGNRSRCTISGSFRASP